MARDGEVVRRLRAAGAVIIGKTRMPAACCGLFGLKPERGRVTSAPMEHLWWAPGTTGPLSRSVLDSAIVYDVIRGGSAGDMFTAAEPATSFTEAARVEPARLRIGWSTKPVTVGVRPDPAHVRAVRDTARLLTGLGHDVREVDPRYPDPTLAFVPQFFGGVRTESDGVERYDRLEKRTRQLNRLGSWVCRPVIDRALRAGERVSVKANRVFDEVDVLLTPTIAHRPPRTGILDRGGPVHACVKAVPMVAYSALWNVTGNPAASVSAGIGEDGLPLACQLVGRRGDETTLLSLSAQIESAQPWSMPVMGVVG
ncbi:MAG: amidase family protein [Marmoricola sp.]